MDTEIEDWIKMEEMKPADKFLQTPGADEILSKVYVVPANQAEKYKNRFRELMRKFDEYFSGTDRDLHLFSSPGRVEIGGNHTDHNNGKVLSAVVDLDTIACACPANDNLIAIHSQGYERIQVDVDQTDPRSEDEGTSTALVRGVVDGFLKQGYNVGGFKAVISSQVKTGSGLSSSASFEVLIGTILNSFFNDNKIAPINLASIGKYAENVHFGKPCGLMDQLTCAVGSCVMIDFKDPKNPGLKKIRPDMFSGDLSLLLVETGGSHAALSREYSSIPADMKEVARVLGADNLSQLEKEDLLNNLSKLRSSCSDLAILRALHFFDENSRVERMAEALENRDAVDFLDLVNKSGISSCLLLQNCRLPGSWEKQGISLALALTRDFIGKSCYGACRVHGGGFEGTILAILPSVIVGEYKIFMEGVFSPGAVRKIKIRPIGAIQLY